MNAVDITARGLALRARDGQAALASPDGAASIGTAQGSTVQAMLEGYPTRGHIKVLNPPHGSRAQLTEAGREGSFIFRGEDHSAAIAADTAEGLFLAPDSDSSGASGAWVRQFSGGQIDFAWFGPAADGVTDDSDTWAAAVATLNVLGLKRLVLPAGTIVLGGAKCCDGLQVVGQGWSDYHVPLLIDWNGLTTIRRQIGADRALDLAGAKAVGLFNFDVDGNGGAPANSGDCIGDSKARLDGTTAQAYGVLVDRVKVYDGNFGFGDNGSVISNARITNFVARENNVGMTGFADSVVSKFTLSSNFLEGAYVNTGQLRFEDGFVEWQRSGTGNAAHGFVIDRNASEVLITGCQFDHNGGQDIRMLGSGSLSPSYIKITGNFFKGAAWGKNLAKGARCSIFSNAATWTGVSIVGNDFQVRDYLPSAATGYRSPHQACNIAGAPGVSWKDNRLNGVGDAWDLSNLSRTWSASGSGSGEYYLTLDSAGVWLDQPDVIEGPAGLLASGAAGSLAAGQWAWADNDSLGFPTVYVRLADSSDPNGQSIFASYNIEPVTGPPSDFETDEWRDRWRGSGFSTTQTFTLKTRQKNFATNSICNFSLHLFGRRHGTNNAAHLVNVMLVRDPVSGAVTPALTFPTTLDSGFTLGSSGTDLILTATSGKLGGGIDFTLTVGTAATYTVEAQLLW